MVQDERLKNLFRLKHDIDKIYFRQFHETQLIPEGLNHTHMKTLMIVGFSEPCAMSAVSRILNLEKGSFTTVANKLIDMGLLEKKRSEEDHRIFNLSLTDEGRELRSSTIKSHFQYLERRISVLSDEERSEYLDLLGKLSFFHEKMTNE